MVLWHRIWRYLNVHCIYAKFMLHLLTGKQRKNPVIVSSDLQETLCKPCCFCWRSSQVMKHGFMCITLKQRSLSSLCLKSIRQIYSSVKAYWFIFQHLYGIMYINLSFRNKMWTSISVWIFCVVYRKMCGRKIMRSGMLLIGLVSPVQQCCCSPALSVCEFFTKNIINFVSHSSYAAVVVLSHWNSSWHGIGGNLMTSHLQNNHRLQLPSTKHMLLPVVQSLNVLIQVTIVLLQRGEGREKNTA